MSRVAPEIESQLPQQSHRESQRGGNMLHSKILRSVKSETDLDNHHDDSIVDLEFDKNLTKIDHAKMKQTLNETHARKVDGQPYTCGDACCGFEPGSHYCIGSSEKSDLTKFGVGIMLYFKLIKHLIFFFFLFTLFSIPVLVLYGASFAAYNRKGNPNYLDLLTATTIGTVGLGSSSCGIAKYETYASSISETEMSFTCPSGMIGSSSQISFGFVGTGSTCNFVEDSDLNTQCNIYTTTTLDAAFSSCVGQSSCTFTVPKDIFVSESNTTCSEIYETQNIYIRVSCSTSTMVLFGNWEIEKTTIAFTIAIIDVAILLIFLVMIYTLKHAQNAATKNVLKKAYSASAYTVLIKNLPQQWPAEELSARLWKFLDYKLGNKEAYGNHRVVDIQIVLPNKLIALSKKYGEIIRQKNTYIREFIQLYAPDYPGKEIDLKGIHAQMLRLKESKHPELRDAKKIFKKIKDLSMRKDRYLKEIKKLKTTNEIRIVCAFVTFSSIPARNKVLDTYTSSPFDRFARILCNCCYDKDISFHGKILQAMSADDPGSINWENLGEPGLSIFLRRALSTLLTIIMWIISGGILLVSTYYKNYFKESYPSVDCTGKDPTLIETANDYLLGDYQTGLLECFCSADIFSRMNTVFTTVDNQKLCLEWLSKKVTENAVTFSIVFGVLIINFGIQFIFQGLSVFEKHSTLNKQIAQRVLKTFVAQFLNTGILILLINSKMNISFWQGKFRDVSPLWYENVGSTLLSTMIINIVTIPFVKVAEVLYQKLRRFCDRGCSSDERRTRKKTQAEYENLYTGPEFIIDFRYSQILTLTFVCFLYSGVMPLLYVTSFVQLVITYFFDKFFLLRVCKLPKNYDEKLEQVVRVTLYGIIVLHLCFSIYAYGNPIIFDQDVSSLSLFTSAVDSLSSQISTNAENVIIKFFRRSQYEHILPLSVFLAIVIVLILVFGVFFGFLQKTVFALCSKDKDTTRKQVVPVSGKGKNAMPATTYTFFHLIKSEDIATLIKLTKVTIRNTHNEELIILLKKKLVLLKQEYLIKKNSEFNDRIDPNLNFIGFFSYDVRLNPRYKAQFAIEEQLDDEDLN